MKLTKDTLPNYFIIASPDNSHYVNPTNTFDFVDRNSDTLVVTIGDSWTWGSDLAPDDDEFRIEHVYGNIVSTRLSADWLNLGQAGSNNFFIAEKTEELGRIINQLGYKKVYVICTFTESGRSFDSHHDGYIDYISWFENNTIDNFLNFLNAECVRRIKQITQTYNIKLLIGTNFIDAVGIDTDVLLPIPWFRLLRIDCPIKAYSGTTGVDRLQAVSQFVKNAAEYKKWMINLINQSKYVDQTTASQKLINLHPDADGHKIWANYVLEHIL
jgi:lysophospholipase L1-like esterase